MATGSTAPEKESIFARLDKLNEFERQPVSSDKLHGGRYFAGLFAGEHVAATEFVIGALFVIWGAQTYDILVGLLLGNALAVLSWTLICAPIAYQTRLTLYWYLRQIGGPVMTVVYNLLNAVLYCILAGCMITVAASAVRIPFGIPPQTGILPGDVGFVVVVIIVGAVVVTLAILGFKRLSQFAVVCSPWMLLMFVCGAMMALPSVGHVPDWNSFLAVAKERIWTGAGPQVVKISKQDRALILDIGQFRGRLQVLKDGAGPVPAVEPTLAEVSVPGFFVAEQDKGKLTGFVPAEARLQPIYGKPPEITAGAMEAEPSRPLDPEAVKASEGGGTSSENVGNDDQDTGGGEQAVEGVGTSAQGQSRPRREGRPNRGSKETEQTGNSAGVALLVGPPIEGWQIVVESAQVADPQVVKYLMPKTRAGVVCDDNYVPLQSFQATVSDGPRATRSPIGFWHIVFFAWICNLAMHLGLSDMAIFRFAKRPWYGLFSAFGMFLGHYLAWICAGIMGAAAARLMMTPLMQLDSGQVAYLILGWAGAIAVVIAGWTTSNPTLYRAGLALQIITPNWPRWLVTFLAGTITTAIACFPFVFLYLLDFVGVYGILLMPVGAIVVIEHWVFPLLGWQRFWATQRGQWLNIPAILAWAIGLALALVCWRTGWLHLFFLVIPVWIVTAFSYLVLAGLGGAARRKDNQDKSSSAEVPSAPLASEGAGKQQNEDAATVPSRGKLLTYVFGFAAFVCLLGSLAFAWFVFAGYVERESVKPTLLYLAIAYFVTGTIYVSLRERQRETQQQVQAA
jgi:purine-cytosine permease-like protein